MGMSVGKNLLSKNDWESDLQVVLKTYYKIGILKFVMWHPPGRNRFYRFRQPLFWAFLFAVFMI